jgi:diguanylate cyclase (GGDEF)-like protein
VPIEQLALLAVVAVMALSAMVVALGAAWSGRRRAATSVPPPARTPMPAEGRAVDAPREALEEAALELPRPGVYDRVVRVVAFLFLAAVVVFTAVSRTYPPEQEVAVYLLVAAGTLFIIVVQDLVPEGSLGRARYWLEAAFAIGFLTVLVGLTGGLHSPFFLGFFLLVAGASLSVEGSAPVLLALVAGAAYAFMSGWVAWIEGIDTLAVTWLVFNLVALGLLAYIASAAGNEQRRAREAALRLSRFDPLTGLFNRNYFFAVLDGEVKRSARMGRGFALLMLDLDDLKPVNDTFGHQYGDRLLLGITEVLQRTVRSTDTAARYGGDEFVVLLPETDPDGAFVVADKLRRDIAALAIRVDERTVRTSVSIGLVTYPTDGANMEQLMSAADAAMYEAKRRGKNQIVAYTTRTERVATALGPERVATPIRREPPAPPGPTGGVQGPDAGAPPRSAPAPSATPAPPPPQEALGEAPPPELRMPAARDARPVTGGPARPAAQAPQPTTGAPERVTPRGGPSAPAPAIPSLPSRPVTTPAAEPIPPRAPGPAVAPATTAPSARPPGPASIQPMPTPPPAWQTRTRPGWPPETPRSGRAGRPYVRLPIETDEEG